MDTEQQQEHMPAWVQANYACRALWKQSKAWREQTMEVEECDLEKQQKMARIARHACGGSEGQAYEI